MKRHKFNQKKVEKYYNGIFIRTNIFKEELINNGNYRILNSLYSEYIENFYYSFAINNLTEEEQIEYANKTLYSYTAYLEGVMNLNTTLELEIAPNKYLSTSITDVELEAFINSNCVNSILLGIILRHDEKVISLRQFDLTLDRKNDVNQDHFVIEFQDKLEDWIVGWKGEKHQQYMDWFEEEFKESSLREQHENDSGLNQAFFAQGLLALEKDNEKQLNELIEKSIGAHHHYYKRKKSLNSGGRSLSDMPQGMISLEALALAAMAYDKGWNITYESDYLPRFLVEYKG